MAANKKSKQVKVYVSRPPIVRPCSCICPPQDALHGRGMRLFNNAPSKGAKPKRYRCTSCLTEREF